MSSSNNQHISLFNMFINYSTVEKILIAWVSISALTGGFIAGIDKLDSIDRERRNNPPVYKHKILERPMRGVYHMSRITAHIGYGAFIAGFTAITAPISIPLYMWWSNSL